MKLAHYIDHTLLRPDTSEEEVIRTCSEAREYGFFAVCIPPFHVGIAAERLRDSEVRVCTVVGFPAGYDHPESKEASLRKSIEDGAQEVDIVLNVSAVKSGRWEHVSREVHTLCGITRELQAKHKFIFETGLLTPEEIIQLCTIANRESVDFVKTSTGVYGEGASVEIVHILRGSLDDAIGIKASGGIRDRQMAASLIEAGASRLGTSRSIQIVQEES